MTVYVGSEGLRRLERQHLTPRLGRAEDIAALVAYLASDEAGYISGVTIQCDGGFMSHMPTFADLGGS